jgi:hypothetical protein
MSKTHTSSRTTSMGADQCRQSLLRPFLGGFKSSPAGRQLPHVSPCKDKRDHRHGRHEGKLCICHRVESFYVLHENSFQDAIHTVYLNQRS